MVFEEMKKQDSKMMEAERLADALLSTTSINQASSILREFTTDDIHSLCAIIFRSGHTMLHLLAQRQKLLPMRALLQRGVGVQARDAQGNTPLHMALLHNCLQAAAILIEEGGANASEVISKRKGTTLLHQMVACDRPLAVKLLLDHKVEVNARDREGRTPFHLAAVYGNCTVAAILLRHEQCDVNALDGMGQTALMLAIQNDNQDLARQLVEAPRVDVVVRDPKDRSGLHLAVLRGQLEVVRSLLRHNSANLHSKERTMGRAPIHLACALVCDRSGIVSSNCVFGEDSRNMNDVPCAQNYNNAINALQEKRSLQEESHTDNMEYLLRSLDILNVDSVVESFPDVHLAQTHALKSKDLASFNLHDWHAVEGGVVNGRSEEQVCRTPKPSNAALAETADVLNGNDVESTPRPRSRGGPSRKQTPRLYSSKTRVLGMKSQFTSKTKAAEIYGSTSSKLRTRHSISGALAQHSVPGDAAQPSSKAPQFQPVSGTHKPSTVTGKRSSLKRPATAPARNPERAVSVSFAEPELPPSVASTFRESIQTPSGSPTTTVTPLNIGLVRCRLVALLLEYGADVNVMTSFRKSPLHIASIMGTTDIVALLLPRVTNVNMLSTSNKTALHLAVERNHAAVTTQLINAGANINLRDTSGMTALHIAARHGFVDIATMLLKAKGDVNATDFRQMVPLHHASIYGHHTLIDLLASAGARSDIVDVDGFTPSQYKKAPVSSGSPESAQSSGDDESDVVDRVLSESGIAEGCLTTKVIASQCDVVSNDPQPALDFQRPGLIFKRRSAQPAS